MEFLQSFLIHHFAWKPVVLLQNVGCFPRLCFTVVNLFVCLLFFLQSLDQNSKQQSVVTPADIYSQFTPKQELKSILRKPSGEGKKKQASKDKVALTEEVQAGITKEKTEKDFDLQKVIC